VEQYNTESNVNYRKALEKIHINTEAQTKDKQTNNEVMIIIIIIIIIPNSNNNDSNALSSKKQTTFCSAAEHRCHHCK
jgi:hypothetical protein